ncbi:hotdog fold thioesterase [Neobacillus jeddahensis]|uniref:hotdog fold thioesterase n=1 Tax=Neobacillus jeddahensis TaxID=1461580 RepID=UPI0006940D20|nr:PaaI family thioesterase [Neobacillus jeddahensis]
MKLPKTNSTFFDYIGFNSGSPDLFQLELGMGPHLLQDDGTVHPGVFATMLDITMGATISLETNSFATTINLNLSFFDLVPKERYQAETRILNKDDKYVTAEGCIYDQDRFLIAKGNGTFKTGSMIQFAEEENDESVPVIKRNVLNDWEANPFFTHIGFEVVNLEEDDILLKLPLKKELLNTNKMAHGGVHASMLSTVQTIFLRNLYRVPVVAMNLEVHYFAPTNSGHLFARANIVQKGYKLATIEAEIVDEDDLLIAKGTGIFKILRKE